MKTIEVKLYSFSELSQKAKEKALKKFHTINVDYDWWDWIVYDLKDLGLELKEFDTYRNHIQLGVNDDVRNIIKSIKENYGEKCGTYRIACQTERELLEYKDKEMIEASEGHFLICMEKEYLNILKKDEEYRYSEEAIIETIEANEYDFLEDGTFYSLS